MVADIAGFPYNIGVIAVWDIRSSRIQVIVKRIGLHLRNLKEIVHIVLKVRSYIVINGKSIILLILG